MKTRNELIAEAKELGLTFERPINQVKTEVIAEALAVHACKEIVEKAVQEEEMPMEAFIAAATGKAEEVKVKKITIADRILELAQKSMSRTAIYNQLRIEHATLNYRYVVQTLLKAKAAGVELNVPRQERVFAPKADAIEKLEAKLAKMKEQAAVAV